MVKFNLGDHRIPLIISKIGDICRLQDDSQGRLMTRELAELTNLEALDLVDTTISDDEHDSLTSVLPSQSTDSGIWDDDCMFAVIGGIYLDLDLTIWSTCPT